MELIGKYTNAIIYTDNVEQEAIQQVYDVINSPAFEGLPVRCMPDIHAGKGICIGFTSPLGNFVNPDHVGVDIGCRMTTIKFNHKLNPDQYALFEHRIKKEIPMGFNLQLKSLWTKECYAMINTEYQKARSAWPEMVNELGRVDEEYLDDLMNRVGMDPGIFYKSIGTAGGGNHFIEYGEDDNTGYVTIHCGSRNFGVKVANYWHKMASSGKINKEELKDIVDRIKLTCKDKRKMKELIDNAKEEVKKKNPNGYLSGAGMRGYITDMVIAQAYAKVNHMMITKIICDIAFKFNLHKEEVFETIHNYIDFTDHIIRKGSINASEGKLVIIPFNMRDGLAICKGKGNTDWNCSAPHGAGRIMSRTAAFRAFSVANFKKEMEGIYSTTICGGTLDECPMVYKPMQEIIDNIKDTVEILYFIKPKINIKATDGGE